MNFYLFLFLFFILMEVFVFSLLLTLFGFNQFWNDLAAKVIFPGVCSAGLPSSGWPKSSPGWESSCASLQPPLLPGQSPPAGPAKALPGPWLPPRTGFSSGRRWSMPTHILHILKEKGGKHWSQFCPVRSGERKLWKAGALRPTSAESSAHSTKVLGGFTMSNWKSPRCLLNNHKEEIDYFLLLGTIWAA